MPGKPRRPVRQERPEGTSITSYSLVVTPAAFGLLPRQSRRWRRTRVPMNDREFRKHLADKRLERLRKEAEAANAEAQAAALKKPPAAAKAPKIKKTRSA